MDKRFLGFLTGIFLVAVATLTYEVALSYAFAYMFWFDSSVAILSTAMFGLGIGGVVGYFLSKRSPERYYEAMHYSSFAFGVLLFVSLYLIAKGSRLSAGTLFSQGTNAYFRGLGIELGQVFPLLYFSFVASIPFIFAGIALSMGLNYPSEDRRAISYIYFGDLIGAGIGSFLVTALLPFFSLEGVVALCSVLALISSLFFKPKKLYLPFATALAVLLMFSALPSAFSPEVSEYKWLAKEKAKGAEVLSAKWDPVSRIDAIQRDGRIWLIENGVSPVEVSRGNPGAMGLNKDPRYFMFDLNPPPRNMLAIGAGGGIELTMALRAGLENITAVEINPLVLKYMKNDFAEFSQGLYFNPRITTIIEDGRTYVHRSREKYDLIENGVVGGVGLFVPSSRVLNFMYVYVFTMEANLDYWNRLTEDGVALTIIYVLLDEYNSIDADKGVSYHLVRQYNTVKTALEKAGVNPEKHMMIFQFHPQGGPRLNVYQGEYTFIFKKELTPEKVADLVQKASNYGLKPAYAPYYSSIDLESYSKEVSKLRSVTPVSDDKPFFYHTEQKAPMVLKQLLLLLGAMTFLFMVLPVLLHRGFRFQSSRSYFFLGYFLCLGVGYILVEAVLIQKLVLFLGRPAYAFQVVLFAMLVFSGIGSFLTARFKDESLSAVTPVLLFATFIAVLGYAFLTPSVIYGYMHYSILPKVLLSIGFIAPLALLMGTPFPTGLRMTSSFSRHDVVWMYALNGAGSVLGSLIGMTIAFSYGYSYAIIGGGLVYLIAFLMIFLAAKKSF